MRINQQADSITTKLSVAGFTIIEILIIILMLGIFSAIAAPSWLAFINNNNLRISQDRIYWAIRTAQSNAKRDKVEWQASFRQVGNVVQWAVHPANLSGGKTLNDFPTSQFNSLAQSTWYNLPQKIAIDSTKTTLTKVDTNNVKKSSGTISSDTIYRALFNHKGCPLMDIGQECGPGGLGKITLYQPDISLKRKRCAIVSTLLGGMRTAEDTGCN
ncbi:MAG TPA: hypothetical protein VK211_15600 [Kamptonema sp.]|nr:hypothetical protein [Kamptonema sp.]